MDNSTHPNAGAAADLAGNAALSPCQSLPVAASVDVAERSSADKDQPEPGPTVSVKKANAMALRTWLKIGAMTVLSVALALFLLRNVLLGTPTNVYAATSGMLVQTVVASGRVISPQRITVALQGSGRVLRVAVAEGQAVERGQLLIELDNSEGRASLAQARAAVKQAQAVIRQLRELGQPLAAQTLAQSQAAALQTQKAIERNRSLIAQGFISQAAVDDAQRANEVAISQVASAQAQVKSSRPGGSDVAVAQAALAQAVAGEELARVKLAQGQVVAPSSGLLISRSVEAGDIVQPGKALMVLAASGQTQILLQIDEKNLSKIALGQKAYGSADAFASQHFDAVVAYINPGVDATRGSVEVKLDVVNPPVYLRQDMTVSVDIETARRIATVVIPTNAVADAASDKPWVLVVRGHHAVKQFVKLGLRGDRRIEVLDGIAVAEGVVPASKVGVKSGQRVRAHVIAAP